MLRGIIEYLIDNDGESLSGRFVNDAPNSMVTGEVARRIRIDAMNPPFENLKHPTLLLPQLNGTYTSVWIDTNGDRVNTQLIIRLTRVDSPMYHLEWWDGNTRDFSGTGFLMEPNRMIVTYWVG